MAFGGAVAGCATGAWLQRTTSLALPLVVGGKPIVAWVPFGVIIFELTMLGAGLCTFVGMAVLASLGRRRVPAKLVEDLARGNSAVMVSVDVLSPADAERALADAGADEVKT
jgi:molybdopterin-containing oxidoreductase family membrane subunit